MTDVSDLQDRWDFILIQHGERVANLQARTAALQERVDTLENAPHKPGFGGFLSRIFNKVVKVWPLKYQLYKKRKERDQLGSLLATSANNVVSNLAVLALETVDGGVLKEDYRHLQQTGQQLGSAQSALQNAIKTTRKAIELETFDYSSSDNLTGMESRDQTQRALHSIQTAMKVVSDVRDDLNLTKKLLSSETLAEVAHSNSLGFVYELENTGEGAHSFGNLLNLYNINDLETSIDTMQEIEGKITEARTDTTAALEKLRNYALGKARDESSEMRVLCDSLGHWMPQTNSRPEKPPPSNNR